MNPRLKKYLRTDNALEALKNKILGADRKTTLIYSGEQPRPVAPPVQAGKWVSLDDSEEERGRHDSESEAESEDVKGKDDLVRIDEDGDLVLSAPEPKLPSHMYLGAKPGSVELNSETFQQQLLEAKQAAPIKRNKAGQVVLPGQDIRTQNQERIKQWSGGIEQAQQAKALKDREEAEKHKPFIRREIEEDVDEELKQRKRYGDPLERFEKPKKRTAISYSFENRFGINPGSRWDGVDRSNGFERRWTERGHKRKDTTNALD